jgi:hypothetical protein
MIDPGFVISHLNCSWTPVNLETPGESIIAENVASPLRIEAPMSEESIETVPGETDVTEETEQLVA